jgi:hypothetical protein
MILGASEIMWSLKYAVPLDTFSVCFVQLYKVVNSAFLTREARLKETKTLLFWLHARMCPYMWSPQTWLLDHMRSKISYIHVWKHVQKEKRNSTLIQTATLNTCSMLVPLQHSQYTSVLYHRKLKFNFSRTFECTKLLHFYTKTLVFLMRTIYPYHIV